MPDSICYTIVRFDKFRDFFFTFTAVTRFDEIFALPVWTAYAKLFPTVRPQKASI